MFKDRIQEKYDSLSARFRVVADFILEHTLEASFMTATELARHLKIDPATVVRFSQELDYNGYRELAREIKAYVSGELKTRYQRQVAEAQTPEERIEHLIADQSDRVLHLKASKAELAQAAQRIKTAREVVFTGKGDAYALAQLWATQYKLIGIPAQALPPTPEALGHWLAQASSDTVLVSFSLGLDSEEDIAYAMRVLKARGGYAMAILPSATLLSAREADLYLAPDVRTPAEYPSLDTLVAAMSIIWQAVILMDPQGTSQTTAAFIEALSRVITKDGEREPEDLKALQRLWNRGQEEQSA